MSDFADELAKLHSLQGADFSRQVERIAQRGEFYPLKGEEGIFVVGGEGDSDYNNLLNAARKMVSHGYTAYILPNPKGIRTADLIIRKKNVYRVYDVKTITGKSSAGNRLIESIGQTFSVILNIRSDYFARVLALNVRAYFETSPQVIEVIVLKGRKMISVKRNLAVSKQFLETFRKLYEK